MGERRIIVKVFYLARNVETLTVEEGSTVADALGKLKIEARGDIFVNSARAGLSTQLKDGDIIGIVGQVEGGEEE